MIANFRNLILQEFRLITFQSVDIDLETQKYWFLGFSILATWLAGIGRYWDHPSAQWWQYAGLGSVIYVFSLTLFLWVIVKPLRPKNWSILSVYIFVGLTSPLAWLYAIPVEKFTSFDTASSLNMIFLLIVAVWRVGLYGKYLFVVANLRGVSWLSALFLPLVVIVTALSMLNLENAVFEIMGGTGRESTSGDKAYITVLVLTYFSAFALPVFLVGYLIGIYQSHPPKKASNDRDTDTTRPENQPLE